jgi:hypothetical protein
LRRARGVAWLGLVLLVLNVLSPALAESLSDAAPPPRAAVVDDFASGRLVICTPTGLRVLSLKGDGDGGAAEDPSAKAYEGLCPFCPPLSNTAAAALPLLAGLLAPAPAAPPVFAPPVRPEPTRPRESLPRVHAPRGPPSVA